MGVLYAKTIYFYNILGGNKMAQLPNSRHKFRKSLHNIIRTYSLSDCEISKTSDIKFGKRLMIQYQYQVLNLYKLAHFMEYHCDCEDNLQLL